MPPTQTFTCGRLDGVSTWDNTEETEFRCTLTQTCTQPGEDCKTVNDPNATTHTLTWRPTGTISGDRVTIVDGMGIELFGSRVDLGPITCDYLAPSHGGIGWNCSRERHGSPVHSMGGEYWCTEGRAFQLQVRPGETGYEYTENEIINNYFFRYPHCADPPDPPSHH